MEKCNYCNKKPENMYNHVMSNHSFNQWTEYKESMQKEELNLFGKLFVGLAFVVLSPLILIGLCKIAFDRLRA